MQAGSPQRITADTAACWFQTGPFSSNGCHIEAGADCSAFRWLHCGYAQKSVDLTAAAIHVEAAQHLPAIVSRPLLLMRVVGFFEKELDMMTERQFRHLPVVEGDQLTGIVSIGDIGKWVISEQRSTIHDLEGYITGNGYAH